jgi:hypothetical protein
MGALSAHAVGPSPHLSRRPIDLQQIVLREQNKHDGAAFHAKMRIASR